MPNAVLTIGVLAPVPLASHQPLLLRGPSPSPPPTLAALAAAGVIFLSFYKLYFECE
jgi:hypothetical protein